MTGPEVLAHGTERPRSRRGLAIGLAAVVALAGIALATQRDPAPDAAPPRPSPSPRLTPSPEPTEPFFREGEVAVPRPSIGDAAGLLLPGDLPGFVTAAGTDVTALEAVGGPAHAPVLIGWCTATHTFQDATGRYRYGLDGAPLGPGGPLRMYPARPDPVEGRIVLVASAGPRPLRVEAPEGRESPGTCPSADLVWPPLPDRVATLEEAATDGARRFYGRYVVTIESRAFCTGPPATERGCRASGWEVYEIPSLPVDDLASEYVYEGEFVVLPDPGTGDFLAVRLPASHLVRRRGTGVRAVEVLGLEVAEAGGGPVLRYITPHPDAPRRELALRDDVRVVLGLGRTGLGQPRATVATLRRFLVAEQPVLLAVLLDADGRAVRVVRAVD